MMIANEIQEDADHVTLSTPPSFESARVVVPLGGRPTRQLAPLVASLVTVPGRAGPAVLGGELDSVEFTREILRSAMKACASSVHLKARGFPMLRVDGKLVPLSGDRLVPGEIQEVADVLMTLARVSITSTESDDGEFIVNLERGCFRVTPYQERGNLALTIHCVHDILPSLATLQIPDDWGIAPRASGLYLVGGERRHDLMAALVERQNQGYAGHIVLLEERQRYLHNDACCLISQQEIGVDVTDFTSGFADALRVDPDWIAVSDVVDVAEAALTLAEDGRRLVLACVDAESPVAVIEQYVSLLPEEDRLAQRARLTRSLLGVMTLGAGSPERLTEDDARCVAWRRTPAGFGR